jgi:hypothetical protein
MRRIILTTALIVLAPLAYAQPNTGTMGGMSNPPGTMGGMSGSSSRATPSSGAPTSVQPDPDNCGTPDERRPCPPMPRNPLPYFPENRR